MSELLTLSGVETHIAQYHILHGVDLGVPDEGGSDLALGFGRRDDRSRR